ncbi:hypothetical protein [Caldinitratiruptor microaerophilus]|uniref:Uncharacterized protein n=1 Tax=Caldinitratiruptor microaerophilus TaxID=671077 RepID=A0AA35CPD1_9FIRM|nr:hypothetical protein [Caldinitratiruptor microaerophilus]BDG61497.1 hypothetical protein caldi_25870 [Caldinitratiruptor microaerophilus]
MPITMEPTTSIRAAVRSLSQAALSDPNVEPASLLATLARVTGGVPQLVTSAAPEARDGDIVVPVAAGGRQFGFLVLRHPGRPFGEAERLLAESAAALIGAVLVRRRSAEDAEDRRLVRSARQAVASLTVAERHGMYVLLSGWSGKPTTVRLNEAAREAGVHHSSLVQALAKLRAAGVLQASSRGRRGVRVRVLNPHLVEELARVEAPVH